MADAAEITFAHTRSTRERMAPTGPTGKQSGETIPPRLRATDSSEVLRRPVLVSQPSLTTGETSRRMPLLGGRFAGWVSCLCTRAAAGAAAAKPLARPIRGWSRRPGRDQHRKDKGMSNPYVQQREGAYWVVGTRVSLDSIVYAFLSGQTAESIAQSFPVLTLEQVYASITFYLANRPDIDAYLEKAKADFAALRQASRNADPMFYQKLADARRHMQTIRQ